ELSPISANGIDLTHMPAPAEAGEIEAVSGACMLIRARDFNDLNGLDEAYPLHFEDLDLFARLAEARRTIRWVPEVVVEHVGGASSDSRPAGVLIDKHRGLWRYLSRHCGEHWPRWQRPLWALAMVIHLALRLAVMVPTLVRERWRR
ncbi:MAG: glycosyltransferase family 2 protein, partial [Wenzhouxiangellaceae bacterium]